MLSKHVTVVLIAMCCLVFSTLSFAQLVAPHSNTQATPRFGGPSSVGAELMARDGLTDPEYRFDFIRRSFQPWFQFKKHLKDCHCFDFALDYITVFQTASNSAELNSAGGGVFRLYGTWTVFNVCSENTGSIVFKVEHRHRIGSKIPPQDLGFEVGSLAITASGFSDIGAALTNLYWQQKFLNGNAAFIAGQVDVTDYLNVYGLVNPWTAFSNAAFHSSISIAAPNQGIGIAGAAYLTKHFYLLAGFADANGDAHNPDLNLFKDFETFKHVELGWTTSPDRVYYDNIHVTIWQVDNRECVGALSDGGIAFSASWFVNNQISPFIRAGFSRGRAALVDRSVTAGIGCLRHNRDLYAIGLNWGRPGDHSLNEQFTTEVFYRFQFSANLSVTADVQLVIHPALNPTQPHNLFAGLRARLVL